MNEHPVFVPLGRDHLSAVVTLPDGDARGLVVLAPGLGAMRSHRFRMWTKAARRLAEEHGVAAVRFDFRALGDSTGAERAWRLDGRWADQLMAVAAFGLEASGAEGFVAAGNCAGAWASLGAAAETPECTGAFLIRMPVLDRGARAGTARRLRPSPRLSSAVRSVPVLGERARARRNGLLTRPSPFVREAFPRALRRGAHVAFLYGERDFTFGRATAAALRRLGGSVPSEVRGNWELRVVPGGALLGFDSAESQAITVDGVVGWSAARFGSAAAAPRGVPLARAEQP